MSQLRLLTSLALLAAVLAGGCGSSDEPESRSAEATAPSETTTPADTEVLDRMPEVPEATESTRPPESPTAPAGPHF